MRPFASQVNAWGNGLAVRLTKPLAMVAGVTAGTPVRVSAMPGRIVIEADNRPTLEQMLAAFDPEKHGGELMASALVGAEVFA